MTRGRVAWYRLALGTALLAAPASAQTAIDLVGRGITAYQNLEFDDAAGLLRRALIARGPGELIGQDRAQAFVYLAATEIFRRRTDSARTVFRQLVLFDPRYRPDQIVFPPTVLNLFDEVRRETKALGVRAPADTSFRPGGHVAVRLSASSGHEVNVTLRREDGRLVRSLYAGPIADSLDVPWDGTDSTGTAVPPGRYALIAASLQEGQATRTVRLPLELSRLEPDTLPLPPGPPDSLLRPESTPFGPALGAFAKGALVGVAVAVLPGMLAKGEDAMGARLVVGGAVTIAGVIGFLSHQPGRAIPANAVHNRGVRDRWRQERARVARENATLRAGIRVRVRAGAPAIVSEAP